MHQAPARLTQKHPFQQPTPLCAILERRSSSHRRPDCGRGSPGNQAGPGHWGTGRVGSTWAPDSPRRSSLPASASSQSNCSCWASVPPMESLFCGVWASGVKMHCALSPSEGRQPTQPGLPGSMSRDPRETAVQCRPSTAGTSYFLCLLGNLVWTNALDPMGM